MFPTAFTHSITQFARTLSLPERIQHSPLRNLSLESLRRRNTTLDSLFYDVKSVTAEEAFYISSCLAAEGAILIVPPTGAGSLKLCDTIDDYLLGGGETIDTLAVAGVGSSALGSAAFARNIADAIDKPVAVVVSGYGLADVMTEALGGYFLFGYLNGFRHQFERLDDFFGRPQFGVAPKLSIEKLAEASLDTQTVGALLAHPRLSFKLILGHSKGNLVISEALYRLAHADLALAQALAARARIITISARIAMPRPFRDVIDVMGEWDWFGEINSRHAIPVDELVPQAGHHTNTDLPNHVPVTETLRKVLAGSAALAPTDETSPRLTDATILTLPVIAEVPPPAPVPETLPIPVPEPIPEALAAPPSEVDAAPEAEPLPAALTDLLDAPDPSAAVETTEIETAEPADDAAPLEAVAAIEEMAPEVADVDLPEALEEPQAPSQPSLQEADVAALAAAADETSEALVEPDVAPEPLAETVVEAEAAPVAAAEPAPPKPAAPAPTKPKTPSAARAKPRRGR
ncbi:hypothetical protein J2858_001774 [Neorhizobium galegae]|uniref:hypothetical protein n=1 Tax=Neorhizobium galegae TaxID=399 RepID=UPI001AE807E0|nr:hypothetical protein [Neorhizobium galegae]MBP2548858.1 hypothetical protein [Neorhizobium galegae]